MVHLAGHGCLVPPEAQRLLIEFVLASLLLLPGQLTVVLSFLLRLAPVAEQGICSTEDQRNDRERALDPRDVNSEPS